MREEDGRKREEDPGTGSGDRLSQLEAENVRLRAALALSPAACRYCQLPANEWAKCKSGFPGCARADDASGCPEMGAHLELGSLKAKLGDLQPVAWETDRGEIYYDKQEAMDDCDGFIEPLFKLNGIRDDLTEAVCHHEWQEIRDWEGDPGVINGVHEFIIRRCALCGEEK